MKRDGLTDIQTRYQNALLRGDRNQAEEIIGQSLHQGHRPTRLYMDVLMTAQKRIGALWHDGDINVAQEHLATEITRTQMMVLRSCFHPRAELNCHAIVTAVAGDMHDLGPLMIADFLNQDGWTVDFLGANTPTKDLISFVEQRPVHLVGLGVTLPEHLREARRVVEALRTIENPPRILLGGHVLTVAPEKVDALGVDGTAPDVMEATREARRLVGVDSRAGGLNRYLRELGQCIQTLRKARRLNQHQLAQTADLDRTYISAVEHGKQNLTLSAVMRLADALDVPFEDLLVREIEVLS